MKNNKTSKLIEMPKHHLSEKAWLSFWSHCPFFSESSFKESENRFKGSVVFSKEISIPTTYCGNDFTSCTCLSKKKVETHVEEIKKSIKKMIKNTEGFLVKKIVETHHKNKETITVEYTLIIEGNSNEFKKSKLVKNK